MKLYIECRGSELGTQLFDWWYAWLQSHSSEHVAAVEVVNNHTCADRRILIDHMARTLGHDDFDRFDMILIGNGAESLLAFSNAAKLHLRHHKSFLLTNSRLHTDHFLYEKNIWHPVHMTNSKDYWTRPFYPQFFEFDRLSTLTRTNDIQIVPGQNRAWRVYFWQMLHKVVPEIQSSSFFHNGLQSQQESFWESDYDTEFRQLLQSLYGTGRDGSNQPYYDASVSIGIDSKFGLIPPGYFLLPCYFTKSCIITAEASWLNHELDISEKTSKCFVSGSLPFPVAGCMVNQQYNDIGFATAWNLLPKKLQKFDSILDHARRYAIMSESVRWLYQNRDSVFGSKEFKDLTENNKKQFLNNDIGLFSVQALHKTLEKFCFKQRLS